MAKVWIGNRSRVAYLRRLSIVYAVELRLRIVTELYMREMSPTQFFEEFGGGSVSRVARHFAKLSDHGWLRLVRQASGGSRRGSTENFYRATELAVFDYDTWSLLPYSIRCAFSCKAFKQLTERVMEAMEAGSFDARADRHLSWTPLQLDRQGWDRVITAVDALFQSLFEEQADARLRIHLSGDEPILAMVALLAFESPTNASEPIKPGLVELRDEPLVPFPVRLSKVLADEMCLRIVSETNLRQMSPPQFCAEVGAVSVGAVRRRFKMLERVGWLIQVAEKTGGRRRGAKEKFYRATGPAILDAPVWTGMPSSTKAKHSWTTFERLSKQVSEAMTAGTFDARKDRYLTWSLLRVDELGWTRLIDAIESLFAFIFEEAREAEARIAVTGEAPVAMTVGLVASEAPKSTPKEP